MMFRKSVCESEQASERVQRQYRRGPENQQRAREENSTTPEEAHRQEGIFEGNSGFLLL